MIIIINIFSKKQEHNFKIVLHVYSQQRRRAESTHQENLERESARAEMDFIEREKADLRGQIIGVFKFGNGNRRQYRICPQEEEGERSPVSPPSFLPSPPCPLAPLVLAFVPLSPFAFLLYFYCTTPRPRWLEISVHPPLRLPIQDLYTHPNPADPLRASPLPARPAAVRRQDPAVPAS